MIRRMKVVGLAAVAVLALTAVSAASASAHTFTAASSPTWLKGEQSTKNVFTVNGGTVKCTGATFTSGKEVGTSLSSVTVHPSYSGCTAFGQEAEVNTGTITNGINYVISAEGTVNIVKVGTGTGIVVKAKTAGCTVTVAPQTGLSSVTFTNEGSPSAVLVTAAVEKITYTSSGGICGESGTNGKYSGSVLTKGFGTETFTEQHAIYWE